MKKEKTVDDAYREWLAGKAHLREITLYKYTYLYEKFIGPHLGKRDLQTLKRKDLSDYYAFLAEERALKSGTIRNYHNIIRQILQYAVEEEYLKKNPADGAWAFANKRNWRKTSRRHSLSVEEEQALLRFLEEEPAFQRWLPVIRVLLGTGLRVGELTGLRWCDVDFQQGMIDVNHTLGRVFQREVNRDGNPEYHYRPYIGPPKTPESHRMIPMLSEVQQDLEMERTLQRKENVCCKVEIDGYTDFIFLNQAGGVQTADALNKAFDRIREAHNAREGESQLPRFTCHTMRHTFATRLCEAGANLKAVQALMGHASIRITMNIYAEAMTSHKQQEMEKLEKLLEDYESGL